MYRSEKLRIGAVYGGFVHGMCSEAEEWMKEKSSSKRYAVVLSKAGVSELGAFLSHLMKKSEGVSYFNCKTIDPNGPYFHMVVEDTTPDDADRLDFAIHIPHSFVIAVTYAADLKRIGFIK